MSPSPRIELLAISPELARAMADGDCSALGDRAKIADRADLLREIAGAYVTLYSATGAVAPWIGYLAIEAPEGRVVGTCGFKEKPGESAIEIAYFTFPGGEGNGIATAMAAALIEIARQAPSPRPIVAHTLAQHGASTAILRKLGFANGGEFDDPEDGTVWRWTLPGS